MYNKIIFSFVILFFTISLLLACDKDNVNKEFGQYAVSVTYSGNSFLRLHFVIDGKECGSLVPTPNVAPSYVEDCSSLKKPDNLTNVFVLEEVPVGEHTLEIRSDEGNVVEMLAFEMLDKECVFQDLNIAFN